MYCIAKMPFCQELFAESLQVFSGNLSFLRKHLFLFLRFVPVFRKTDFSLPLVYRFFIGFFPFFRICIFMRNIRSFIQNAALVGNELSQTGIFASLFSIPAKTTGLKRKNRRLFASKRQRSCFFRPWRTIIDLNPVKRGAEPLPQG